MFNQSSETESQYIERIRKERAQRDKMMKDPYNSPLTSQQIQKFTGLKYFDIDPKFKITAQLNRSVGESEPVTMTDGSERTFSKYGTASFSLDGKNYSLNIFAGQGMPEFGNRADQLFILFKDQNSGLETSENGRYITVEDTREGDVIEVDFNRAYNTFSVYNQRYVSIIAPEESQKPPAHSIGQRKFEDR